jgi:hypothetical protein
MLGPVVERLHLISVFYRSGHKKGTGKVKKGDILSE